MENGILPVYKPVGNTSYEIVETAKKITGAQKVGHGGTLDPFAEGLLILMFNNATSFFDIIQTYPKTYYAVMELGKSTDTLDSEGEVIETRSISGITEDMVREAASRYVGEFNQLVPKFSAAKHLGKPMYEAARKGEETPTKMKRVCIYNLLITQIDFPEVHFTVTCSSGTYVRQLGQDIGDDLGTGAYLKQLMRLSIGSFNAQNAVSYDQLKNMSAEEIQNKLLSVELFFKEMDKIQVRKELAKKILHGLSPKEYIGFFDLKKSDNNYICVVDNSNGRVLAVLKKINRRYKYFKVFNGVNYFIK